MKSVPFYIMLAKFIFKKKEVLYQNVLSQKCPIIIASATIVKLIQAEESDVPTTFADTSVVNQPTTATTVETTQAAIHSLAARAYAQTLPFTTPTKQTTHTQASPKVLPKTGETSTLWMTILGFVSLGLIGKVKNRQKD